MNIESCKRKMPTHLQMQTPKYIRPLSRNPKSQKSMKWYNSMSEGK
jgi:hypothetical protein